LLSGYWKVDPEQILVGQGEESILKDIIHYYCFHKGRQGKILMPDFSWWYYSSIAEESNSNVFSYPVRERGDLWESDPKEIVEMANAISPDILLLASPNNPTGNAFSFDELKWILKNVDKHLYVFIDQAYCKWDVESMKQTIDLLNNTPNVMIGRTFSKFFGLPGLRIGFCLLGERNQALYKYVHRYLGYNRLSNHIACAALTSCDYYNHIADEMDVIKRFIKDYFSDVPGFQVYMSQANFVLCKFDESKKTDLEQELVASGFKVRFINGPDGSGSFLRFSLAPMEVIRELVSIIKKILQRQ